MRKWNRHEKGYYYKKVTIGNKSMKRDDDKDSLSLPMDLIIYILTKLPPRSVSKLICVSKLWSSIIQGKHFTDLYIIRSSARPLLLFQYFCLDTRMVFHCSPQENPPSDRSINPKTIPGFQISPPVRGLICVRDYASNLFVGNPSTGQFLALPGGQTGSIFFGYDPVNDLYKVLSTDQDGDIVEHRVFTLGAQKAWRSIECKYPYCPQTEGICKNGVVYYGALSNDFPDERSLVVCFDLRSEEFSLITLPEGVRIEPVESDLVNYNGKIALVNESNNGKFDLWVLMDVSKQEWTKFSVLVPCWEELVGDDVDVFLCRGTTSTGELIFEPSCSPKHRFFILYYDPKEDKARRVDFAKARGVAYFSRRTFFLGHVESPMFLPRGLSV